MTAIMDSKKNKPKEKRRSNEKRKEKSRDAARCRRSRETDIFSDLSAALPISPEQASHLDKASIMRLAIAYLKVRCLMKPFPGSLMKCDSTFESEEVFLRALDGFIMVLSNNGDVIYLSQNVSDYLGVSQMDMMGQSVYDYSHPCDHDEIRECFTAKQNTTNGYRTFNFFLRLKCTLTSKGRKVNLKSASYKVIHCTGHLAKNSEEIKLPSEDKELKDESKKENSTSLVLVGSPVPHPSNIEIPLGRYTFLSKHNLNMKFTYADEKLTEFLGWDSTELVGNTVYEFYHALDNGSLEKAYKSLFHKGQCETIAYRFLGKGGGYAWVMTQATLIRCTKQHKPISVVCVNYILSGIECENEVYSSRQLEARKTACVKPTLSLEQTKAGKVALPHKSVLPTVVPETKSITASPFRFCNKKKEPKTALPKPQTIILEPHFNQDIDKSDTPKYFINDRDILKENKINGVEYCNTERVSPDLPECIESGVVNPLNCFGTTLLDQELLLTSDFNITPPAETNTASIFAPRTEDMNKGFLTFSEDQPGLTMLKDEPEDLTHLAPTAGDVCVPLEDTPFLTDMLDEFILGETICPLLSPDIPSEVPITEDDLSNPMIAETDSSCNVMHSTSPTPNKMVPSLLDSLSHYETKDPFIYRDSTSRSSVNTDLSSPAFSKGSERSIDSLYSPNSHSGCGDSTGGGGLSEDEMLMLSISDVIDDDMNLRAPYITMEENDNNDALQLLISDDMVMWGPTQSAKRYKWSSDSSCGNVNTNSAYLYKNETIKLKDDADSQGACGLVNPSQVLAQNNSHRKRAAPTSNQVVNERPQKRTHSTCDRVIGSAKKRLRSDALRCPSTTNRGSSQLLQQLVSQTSPKNCWIQSPGADMLLGNAMDDSSVVQAVHTQTRSMSMPSQWTQYINSAILLPAARKQNIRNANFYDNDYSNVINVL